jgi:Fe-S cluster assembly ATPase SufC
VTATLGSLVDAHAKTEATTNALTHLLRLLWAASRHQPSLKDHARVLADRVGAYERGRLARRSGPARVACIGRTVSGKSTLRYALTGEAEYGIGRGGQRTTTENIEYAWADLVVIDTPGVGAHRGVADEVVADVAVQDADAALWVTSSDGVQLATAEPIRRFLTSGVPFIVLVNHREALDGEEAASRPDEQLFKDVADHEERIRQVLTGLDVAPRAVLHAQLHLARLGRSTKDSELLDRSCLRRLEAALTDLARVAIDERETTRWLRIRTEVRRALDDVSTLRQSVSELREGAARDVETAETAAQEALERVASDSSEGLQSAARTARARLASALRGAVEEEHRGKAQHALTRSAQQLLDEHSNAVRTTLRRCHQEAASAFTSAVDTSAADPPRCDAQGLELTLAGDPLTTRAVRTAARVVTAATTIPFPPLRLARLVVQPVLQLGVHALAPSVEEEIAKRRASAADAGATLFDQLTRQDEAASRARDDVLAAVADAARARLVPRREQRARLENLEFSIEAATNQLEALLD